MKVLPHPWRAGRAPGRAPHGGGDPSPHSGVPEAEERPPSSHQTPPQARRPADPSAAAAAASSPAAAACPARTWVKEGRGEAGSGPRHLRQEGCGLRRGGVSGAEGHRGAVATSSRAAPGSRPPQPIPWRLGAAAPAPRAAPPPDRPAPARERASALPLHHREERGARRLERAPRARPLAEPRLGGGAGRSR